MQDRLRGSTNRADMDGKDPDPKELSVESTKLVIIGAGIAGLAAARTLEKEGFQDYLLLEAQNTVGGRINSVPLADGWIELGAQFVHGDKSDLARICLYRGLISDVYSGEGEGAFIRDDGVQLEPHLVKEVGNVVDNILTECEGYANNNEIVHTDIEPNIGKVLRTRFAKYLKMKNYELSNRKKLEEIFNWYVRFHLIDNACMKLDELSVKKWGNFKPTGPEYLVFKKGYNTLLESILSKLNRNNLRLNSPVNSIEWNKQFQKSIIITLANKRQILTNSVIVTCSLGYLKKHHKKMFQPPLPPNLSLAIESLGFGLINKVFLDFGEPWWGADTKGFQFTWRQDDHGSSLHTKLPSWTQDLTGFDVLNSHRAVLLGWVGGQGAYIVETLSEQQIAQDCLILLQYFLKRNDISTVKKCLRTCWYKNQYVIGGYSHITTACDSNGISSGNLLEPVWSNVDNGKQIPIIMLAGEATSEHYFSTTHGAYETGIKQAQVFLRHRVEIEYYR